MEAASDVSENVADSNSVLFWCLYSDVDIRDMFRGQNFCCEGGFFIT